MLKLSISEVASTLRDGKISPIDLCKKCLSRAEDVKKLNAFVRILDKEALNGASESHLKFQQEKVRSKLEGVTIAVKDNFCTEGITTTCSSRMLNDFVPTYNATVVQRLRDAGSILIGKTNMDEFAMGSGTVDSIHGVTKNIWGSDIPYTIGDKSVNDGNWSQDGERVAGGSSGGSAVAVATGACYAALGSDTGGSTRNPAAYCGIVGLKPTYGSVSRYGLIPLVNSMDVPGIMARSVGDVAHVFNVISGFDENDSTTLERNKSAVVLDDRFNISNLKVGIPKEYHCPGMSPVVVDAWKRVAKILEEAGANVSQVSLPHTGFSIACYSVLNQCEVASNMARYDGLEYGLRSDQTKSTEQLYADSRKRGFNDVVRGRILAGNYFLIQSNYEKYFMKAMKVRRLIANDFKNVWSKVDLLLTPVTLSEPPLLKEFIKLDNREQCSTQDFCTQPANMSGCPAISLPVCLSSSNLPISLQLMAPNFQEQLLLSASHWLENELEFPKLEVV
ncbi:glutamyl-tRNA(Gln) amidotransferase subunit A, mitochondrial [Nilaparvata lugens]|uniref:glutamyl-tRNA(Gln) amidotransferase subunit A, mitochondrial n=1 Tax=Nilaparvata lugens TaxID=108931 RepID=UPI00193D6A8A|nr:glutamyl-tRNA(Gln) amidotransferase subunit A, mitochondrial [Nilaparvata lugens]